MGLIVPKHLEKTVALGYITGGSNRDEFMQAVMRFREHDGGPNGRKCLRTGTRGKGIYLPLNRNIVGMEFLSCNIEYLLSIDTDIMFEPEHVYRLLDTMDSEHQIVSGFYYSLTDEGQVHSAAWNFETPRLVADQTPRKIERLQELASCGFGFCMIHRSVFQRIQENWPKEDPWKWFGHDLVPLAEQGQYGRLGEDVSFCMRARELGIKTWGFGEVFVSHVKTCYLTPELYQRLLPHESQS